jgi:Domain of unknown function (DUF4129)
VPSRNRSRLPLATAVLLIAAAPLLANGPSSKPTLERLPDRAEIARAIDTVKADPNLATERTIRTLEWRDESKPTPPRNGPVSLEWLLQLIEWFAQSARVLVWVAAALLVGLLAIYLVRLLRARVPSANQSHKIAPTHVQDLDIRPESLPDNIGAEARALWDRGQHRAALSLLYRGLLSRLVHVHNVPIRDSSTEGDTLQLAATRLRNNQKSYVTRLIRVWQHAVYGGQQPESESLYVLCDEFAPALDIP